MSKFKFGEKVVKIKDGLYTKKGEIYTVDGFHCCPKCGIQSIYLLELNYSIRINCDCNCEHGLMRVAALEENFEKLISLSDCIEYKLKVSIPELIEIKEYQNQ